LDASHSSSVEVWEVQSVGEDEGDMLVVIERRRADRLGSINWHESEAAYLC
jgi:hypothetical protein